MEWPGRLPIFLSRIRAQFLQIRLVATSETCQVIRKRSLRGSRPLGGRGHPDALGREGGERNTAAHGGRATDEE